MSRSYKKTPGFCDRNPWAKRYANKRLRVRPLMEIPNGRHFKKFSCSYDICDYKFLCYSDYEVRRWVENYDYKRYELFMK